jgi:hypothetical protein
VAKTSNEIRNFNDQTYGHDLTISPPVSKTQRRTKVRKVPESLTTDHTGMLSPYRHPYQKRRDEEKVEKVLKSLTTGGTGRVSPYRRPYHLQKTSKQPKIKGGNKGKRRKW